MKKFIFVIGITALLFNSPCRVQAKSNETAAITVARAASDDAYLSYIGLNHGYDTFSPAFVKTTTSYTESVTNAITSIEARIVTNNAGATVKVNGKSVTSGIYSGPIALNVGPNMLTIVVTAQDGVAKMTYEITVTRAPSDNAYLAFIGLNHGYDTFSPVFVKTTTSYTESVSNAITSIQVEPITDNSTATVTVNGTIATSGTYSGPIALNVGPNTLTIVVTAQDGGAKMTYKITVTRAPSDNAYLAFIGLNHGYDTFSPVFVKTTTSYTESVPNTITSIQVEPITNNSTATVTVNGTIATSGTYSGPIALNVGPNTLTIVVTAQDGGAKMTYNITVTRAPASDAWLSFIRLTHGVLSPVFAKTTTNYTDSVPNTITLIQAEPIANDPTETIRINGTAVLSETYAPPLTLNVGPNTIKIVVTAQDGVTTHSYTVTVIRASMQALNSLYQPISVVKPTDSVRMENDGILVHQGLSPNGDGVNDFLLIEGINAYPENELTIINRSGALIYQAKGYDNSSKIFDGHSNINGTMQLPGTYFYSLDYMANGLIKHKTGYIILKY